MEVAFAIGLTFAGMSGSLPFCIRSTFGDAAAGGGALDFNAKLIFDPGWLSAVAAVAFEGGGGIAFSSISV